MALKHILVADYFAARIRKLERAGHFSTGRNYRATWESFQSFLEDRPMRMDEFNRVVVARYNRFLVRRGLKRNTISFYNRILRALYNRAVREGYARQAYPFSEAYTGVDITRKRALSTEVLGRIAVLEVNELELALARDLFLFSFQARGMSFVDMAYLERKNLLGDILFYARRKTSQSLQVRVEPWMQVILDRWKPLCCRPYLLPILSSRNPKKAHAQYGSALGVHNRNLRRIGEMVGLDYPLSSYCARHSWATVARDSHIPISIISSSLGHSSERTTRIYLAEIDNEVIDAAARQVWDVVSRDGGEQINFGKFLKL